VDPLAFHLSENKIAQSKISIIHLHTIRRFDERGFQDCPNDKEAFLQSQTLWHVEVGSFCLTSDEMESILKCVVWYLHG